MPDAYYAIKRLPRSVGADVFGGGGAPAPAPGGGTPAGHGWHAKVRNDGPERENVPVVPRSFGDN